MSKSGTAGSAASWFAIGNVAGRARLRSLCADRDSFRWLAERSARGAGAGRLALDSNEDSRGGNPSMDNSFLLAKLQCKRSAAKTAAAGKPEWAANLKTIGQPRQARSPNGSSDEGVGSLSGHDAEKLETRRVSDGFAR